MLRNSITDMQRRSKQGLKISHARVRGEEALEGGPVDKALQFSPL